MEILQLASQDDLNPKRVSSTNGGEYHSPCPGCNGKDRFIIWSAKNRYYCRQCGKTGDVIQYLRDFHGFSFKEACLQAEIPVKERSHPNTKRQAVFTPLKSVLPNSEWQAKASLFIYCCHQCLLNTPTAINLLQQRGLSLNSIKKFKLGWNSETSWANWLIEEPNKKIWLPKGIVIPSFREQQLYKIKVRRSDWHVKDKLPKYVEIHGNASGLVIYNPNPLLPIVILESELDAMLVQQEAGNLCSTLALGGATKKPDLDTHQSLIKSPLILFSLDYDEAGIKAFKWWKKQYKNLFIWVAPFEKSVGDAFLQGLDIKAWISLGIEQAFKLKNNKQGISS